MTKIKVSVKKVLNLYIEFSSKNKVVNLRRLITTAIIHFLIINAPHTNSLLCKYKIVMDSDFIARFEDRGHNDAVFVGVCECVVYDTRVRSIVRCNVKLSKIKQKSNLPI